MNMPYNSKPVTLSPRVSTEIRKDLNLFTTYLALFGRYDDDIEPLHNADWKLRQIKIEENERLPKAKKMLELATNLF